VTGLVINRFGGAGLRLDSGYNTVTNDYIGTDLTGAVARPNSLGVYVNGTSYNVIGGTTASARDVISGNLNSGVYVYGSGASYNTVEGDFIGTDVSGSRALGNGTGVAMVYAPYNTIGVSTAGNVISGNGGDGVDIVGSTAWGNVVQSNKIGTDVNGLLALGNANGVLVNGAPNSSIGSQWGYGNTIAGNRGNGVVLTGGGASFNHVQNNAITGNGGSGVDITGSASNNTVGGFFFGWSEANTIASNRGYGVFVESGTGDTIRNNSIYANALGGIHLGPGANNNQPAPVISFLSWGGPYQISGTLRGPAGTYTIDFYANAQGTSQGRSYLGSMAVTIGSTGSASFVFSSPVSFGLFDWLTATATDSSGNTSEFSQPGYFGGF
jgi:titin